MIIAALCLIVLCWLKQLIYIYLCFLKFIYEMCVHFVAFEYVWHLPRTMVILKGMATPCCVNLRKMRWPHELPYPVIMIMIFHSFYETREMYITTYIWEGSVTYPHVELMCIRLLWRHVALLCYIEFPIYLYVMFILVVTRDWPLHGNVELYNP